LLIADICGYTAFLTGNELEHAQGIIRDLTRAIVSQLVPPLELVKLEGDAVFCHVPVRQFEDGERILEAVEACYVEFRDFLDDMARGTTCRCSACESMQSLDLKFVAHYGRYLVDDVGGVRDLAGPDVILVHRLLKNDVTSATGLRAYAFFSDACRERLPPAMSLVPHAETYENLGEVRGGLHDLAAVLEARREARRVFVEPSEAHFEFLYDLPVPASVAWQYFVDPAKRMLYDNNLKSLDPGYNDAGRTGVGAESHCCHGSWDSAVRVLDWRPYHYFSQRMKPVRGRLQAPPQMVVTAEFEEKPDGCVVHFRGYFEGSALNRLKMKLLMPVLSREFRAEAERLRALVVAEAARDEQPETVAVPAA
jgi:hypothetical protein